MDRAGAPGHSASAWQTAVLALLAGALNVFAFAPFGIWPLQILALAFVFRLAIRADSAGRCALIGWLYSTGTIVAGTHWLYISMHDYGGMPGWMAALAVLLLGAGLGALAGLAFGLVGRLGRKNPGDVVVALLMLPAAWTLAEWARGWIFTGFPWVGSGYAHSAAPLAGFAPLVGVYGLAWLAALVAGSIALLPRHRLPVIAAALLLIAGWGLRTVDWTAPHGKPISVRLLQGNVPQEMKFVPEHIADTLALYRDLITAQPADLIATPETALPLLSNQLPPDYLPRLADFARDSGSHLLIGLPLFDGPGRYANSVLGLPADASGDRYRYDKHHLVPFGEFIPTGFRWFVDMMRIPLGDFSRGKLPQAPFRVGEQAVLPNICYEDLFGEEIAAQLQAGAAAGQAATMLLNVSNIAWFGDSIALPQHLQISQMRALETGRPMLRATNTGATAVVGPKGEVLAQAPPFERSVLSASVQGYAGLTPYVRYGNLPVVAVSVLLLMIGALYARRHPHKPVENR